MICQSANCGSQVQHSLLGSCHRREGGKYPGPGISGPWRALRSLWTTEELQGTPKKSQSSPHLPPAPLFNAYFPTAPRGLLFSKLLSLYYHYILMHLSFLLVYKVHELSNCFYLVSHHMLACSISVWHITDAQCLLS